MGWDDNKPNDSKQQTLATSTIGEVVGWDGLGRLQTKRQQAADTSNIDHRRSGGMGWAGTITNKNDSKQQTLATSTIGGVVGWDGLGQ